MMPKKWLLRVLVLLLIGTIHVVSGAFIGVDIRTTVPNIPPASQVVKLLNTHQISHVRLYNADPRILWALANTSIEVMVGVTNEELLWIGKSSSKAAEWIKKNVAAYVPEINITAIAVGDDILTKMPPHAAAHHILVHAMDRLHLALVESNLDSQISVSTPLPMDMIIPMPFPPSGATFNTSWEFTMKKLLQFLKKTNSYFMVNAYPYYEYAKGGGIFPLEYALFEPLSAAKQIVDPVSQYHYTSMFDAMVDAVYYSIDAYNFSGIPVVVTETGWPWSKGATNNGSTDETVKNAEIYTKNLIRRVLNDSGPPSQPSMPINTYIYELFTEDDFDQGGASERKWGLFDVNGVAVYNVSFDPSDVSDNSSVVFCIAKETADAGKLMNGLNWACGEGHADCSAIQEGQPCYYPDTFGNHASYAYNDYYQKMHSVGGTCDFGGTATTTTIDPSYGSCVYTGSNKTQGGGFSNPTALGPMISPPLVDGSSSSSRMLFPKIVDGLILGVLSLWFCL